MRGTSEHQAPINHTFNVEAMIEPDHPLRPIKRMVDAALASMSRAFCAAYSDTGRPGIPPESLLKALLLRRRYTIRSEREWRRWLKADLHFRWFLGLQPSDDAFDHSVLTHSRERLAEHGLTRTLVDSVGKRAIDAGLTSDEHVTVGGTLIRSHASRRSLGTIGRTAAKDTDDGGPSSSSGGCNPSLNFKADRRANATHASATDPEARLDSMDDGEDGKDQVHGRVGGRGQDAHLPPIPARRRDLPRFPCQSL
jgi:transposase